MRDRLHFAAAVVVAWLIVTSPWVALLHRIPSGAGWLALAHVAVGFVGLGVAAAYSIACVRAGGWRLYFPWVAGTLAPVRRDLSGLLRGQLPTAEGGGLFAMIEGLLLIALALTALTGAAWFLAQGTEAALDWRAGHIVAARALTGLLVLHVLAVASHVRDFAG